MAAVKTVLFAFGKTMGRMSKTFMLCGTVRIVL
jgi:hypothetical protein